MILKCPNIRAQIPLIFQTKTFKANCPGSSQKVTKPPLAGAPVSGNPKEKVALISLTSLGELNYAKYTIFWLTIYEQIHLLHQVTNSVLQSSVLPFFSIQIVLYQYQCTLNSVQCDHF